jgi:sucrose phosphorylase
MNHILDLLLFIYGEGEAQALLPKILEIIERPVFVHPQPGTISNRDALLICYGDMLSGGEGGTALSRLGRFLAKWNRGVFSFLHLLPFHPYSSDDGFSVIDYRTVDPRLGGWDDIEELGRHFKMVFDFVVNHGSVQSEWFRKFLADDEQYRAWYVTRPEGYDESNIFRPRTHPLFTVFTKGNGSETRVWTTFSEDQADYDFSQPEVLLEFIRIFLEYVRRGARILRLDAIAFLWKEDGTPCLHHPKTHAFVKLLRAIIDYRELPVLLLTETNVLHCDNLSYFGGAYAAGKQASGNEAHIIYNFALPPLMLHAAVSGDAGPLRAWAAGLPSLPTGVYFLNFLASHDGVGLGPAKGLIDDSVFGQTLEEAKKRGALISMKNTPVGQIPYELNCSWADITAPPDLGSTRMQAGAMLTTYAAAMALPGLPAVYFHSWIGSRAWKDGPRLLGYNRAINREKPDLDAVENDLAQNGSFRSLVLDGFRALLEFRTAEEAFNPEAPCRILDTKEKGIFAVYRPAAEGGVFCAHNFSGGEVKLLPAIPPLAEVTIAPHSFCWIAFDASAVRRELNYGT